MSKYIYICTVILFLSISSVNAESGASADYFEIIPPLVVNVYHPSRIKFLQVDSQVKIENSDVVASLELHKAAIRHSMLMLLSNQDINFIKTVKGKEKLRQQTLEIIKSVLKETSGTEGVTDLYFTGFIIQ